MRDQDEMLGDTPAGLLAGNADPSLSYLVEGLGNQEGIDWISIFPKRPDAAFSQIQFGFELDTLRMVQMLDPLQQITRIRFWDVNVNLDVPVGKFSLILPEGTDIIREGNGVVISHYPCSWRRRGCGCNVALLVKRPRDWGDGFGLPVGYVDRKYFGVVHGGDLHGAVCRERLRALNFGGWGWWLGFLEGLRLFSAFSSDVLNLLQSEQWFRAMIFISSSILLCVVRSGGGRRGCTPGFLGRSRSMLDPQLLRSEPDAIARSPWPSRNML